MSTKTFHSQKSTLTQKMTPPGTPPCLKLKPYITLTPATRWYKCNVESKQTQRLGGHWPKYLLRCLGHAVTNLVMFPKPKFPEKKINTLFHEYILCNRSWLLSAILQNDVICIPALPSLVVTQFLEFSGDFWLALELLCQNEKAIIFAYKALTNTLNLVTMDPSRRKISNI